MRLRGALGVDQPPFATDYKVGGNSVGLACISGIPANGIVRITINSGTGTPPTINGSAGADGTVIIPFPIQQFGAMNASITLLMVNAQPTPFIADPFTYTVVSGDAPRLGSWRSATAFSDVVRVRSVGLPTTEAHRSDRCVYG